MKTDKGEVFGWGNSEYGQLPCTEDNQQINKPRYVECTKGLGRIVDIASGGSICLVLNGEFSYNLYKFTFRIL